MEDTQLKKGKPAPGAAAPKGPQPEEEPELYVEPPKMTGREMAGVVVALIALAIIGFSGYVWLNPDLSMKSLLSRQKPAVQAMQTAPAAASAQSSSSMPGMDMSGDGATDASGTPSAQPAAAAAAPAGTAAPATPASPPPAQSGTAVPAAGASAAGTDTSAANQDQVNAAADKPVNCAYCGMPAAKSASYVIAHWSDGMKTVHDSWDCVFKYGKENKMVLSSAEVKDYGSAAAQMLDAASSWYLYDTKSKVAHSMPPYVAAYKDKAGAETAQPAMGGEVVDFAGLKSKWG